jgi:glutathione S-transferase
MPLKLYAHPLSSFCWKALIALYEAGADFEFAMLDQDHPQNGAELVQLWPVGKMPLLSDEERGLAVPETTIIIEYIDRVFGAGLIPADPDAAMPVRFWDRFYDLYVQVPMQKIVADRLRPPESRDAFGVAQARADLKKAYAAAEAMMGERTWAAGEDFTLADCAACPALWYGEKVEPFTPNHPRLAALFERLKARPSFARVLDEHRPYEHMFPTGE